MKHTILIFLVSAICFSCSVEENNGLEQFRGRWKLHKIEYYNDSGQWTTPERLEGRNGFILYDGIGGMGVHHVPKDFDKYMLKGKYPIDSLETSDLRHIAGGNFVYFGKYVVKPDSSIVEHHLESNSNPTKWDIVNKRYYEFRHDTLTLTPIDQRAKRRIIWIKLNDR